jgi:integrase
MAEFGISEARAVRDVIARFGRHPHRNEVLGRTSTPEELEYLETETPPHLRRPPSLEALRSHLERQLEEIDRVGSLWLENGLIFASEVGEPLERHYTTKHRFKPLLKRARLPEIRFHDLRHTCATLLLSKNVNPKIVSEMLGHATIAITLDTYSHVLPTMQESAAKAMEDALA